MSRTKYQVLDWKYDLSTIIWYLLLDHEVNDYQFKLYLLIFGDTGIHFALPGTLEILDNIGKYLAILIDTIQYWDKRDNICQYWYQQMLKMDSTWQQR